MKPVNATPAIEAICDMVDPDLPAETALAAVSYMIAMEMGIDPDVLIAQIETFARDNATPGRRVLS